MFRHFFPRRRHPLLDDSLYVAPEEVRFANVYDDVMRMRGTDVDDFTRARYEEGRRWRGVLRDSHKRDISSVLDVGGGNGAIELAFNADPRFRAVSVEMLWNDEARLVAKLARTPMRRVIADAGLLPFRNTVFDAATCLETLEHLNNAAGTAAEIARVCRPGALLLITTPPRWRYSFAPDPHFGIRGLALLPARLQRAVAARRGFREEHHYVNKLYGSIRELAEVFKDFRIENILSRSRAPRRWFWDAVLLRKPAD
jgi:SAM-dependent methyltransferase